MLQRNFSLNATAIREQEAQMSLEWADPTLTLISEDSVRLIGCLHNRANIEQLARRSMVVSMLITRGGGL